MKQEGDLRSGLSAIRSPRNGSLYGTGGTVAVRGGNSSRASPTPRPSSAPARATPRHAYPRNAESGSAESP